MTGTMNDVLTITRGALRLRLCSNGLRWWVECDDLATGDTYRHGLRAGSRAGVTPHWDRTLAEVAGGVFTPKDDSNGTWWRIGYCPE